MTKEEYQALAKRTIEINAQEYWDLKCRLYAAENFVTPTRICPKCYESFLVDGYICLNCGYDSSYDEEEEE